MLRSLNSHIKKTVTGWVMACIVKDLLGALCPWFDSWEPGIVATPVSRVSGVTRSSNAKSHFMNRQQVER